MAAIGLRPNRFKQSLLASKAQVGLWASACSPIVTEALAHSGLDWLCVDMEHAPNRIESVLAQLHAAQLGSAHPVVRVPGELDVPLVKRLLDVGAQSLLFPMVESAEQARAIVSATRYPPAGIRGVMSTMRATSYATEPEDLRRYYASAAEELAVVVQVESAPAARIAADIGAVEGVDGVFVGPVRTPGGGGVETQGRRTESRAGGAVAQPGPIPCWPALPSFGASCMPVLDPPIPWMPARRAPSFDSHFDIRSSP
jgi:4-hydroxy-2-oxoheptanedioate aldolase